MDKIEKVPVLVMVDPEKGLVIKPFIDGLAAARKEAPPSSKGEYTWVTDYSYSYVDGKLVITDAQAFPD